MKIAGRRILVALIILAMMLGTLPANLFAAEGETTLPVKTVTIYAVIRDTSGDTVNHDEVIAPTKVTVYEDTQLRYLLDDLTGKTTTYSAGTGTYGGRLLTLNGRAQLLTWRGFTKSRDGEISGYMNVRDQKIKDGDTIILTTAEKAGDPYQPSDFPSDLNWDEIVEKAAANAAGLTQNTQDALDSLTSDAFLNEQDAGSVTEKLTFPSSITYDGGTYRLSWSSRDRKSVV